MPEQTPETPLSPADVPAELVEAAARALRDEQCTGRDHGTAACPDRHCRDDSVLPWYRDRVRGPLAAVLPMHEAAVLNAVADDWQRGAWADVPRSADRVRERLAVAQHVTNWLRARATRRSTGTSEPEHLRAPRGQRVTSTRDHGAEQWWWDCDFAHDTSKGAATWCGGSSTRHGAYTALDRHNAENHPHLTEEARRG
jgi:hypothetical protein